MPDRAQTAASVPGAAVTVRGLAPELKARLRVRAAHNARSMEAEARAILEAALAAPEEDPTDLAAFARSLFAPLGGVELELPGREPSSRPTGLWAGGRNRPGPDTQCESARPKSCGNHWRQGPSPVIVLDTNVLSELAKAAPDAAVAAWVAQQRRAELCTTAVSEAELAYGLALLPNGRRRDALVQAVARLLGEGLGGRVMPFDRAAAATFGAIAAERRAAGRPIATANGQIAAIARAAGAALVATRDAGGFQGCRVALVNPGRCELLATTMARLRIIAFVLVALSCRTWPIVPPSTCVTRMLHRSPGLNI